MHLADIAPKAREAGARKPSRRWARVRLAGIQVAVIAYGAAEEDMAMNTASRVALTTGAVALGISVATAALAGAQEPLNWLTWQLSYLLPSGIVGAVLFLLMGLALSCYVAALAFLIGKVWSKRRWGQKPKLWDRVPIK